MAQAAGDAKKDILEVLSIRYRKRASRKRDDLIDAWDDFHRASPNDRTAAIEKLHELACQIAGNGVMFGFPQVGSTALDLNDKMLRVIDGADLPDELILSGVDRLAAALDAIALPRK